MSATRHTQTFTLRDSVSAVSLFNGDEFGGIKTSLGINTIKLPYSMLSIPFQGYFNIILTSSLTGINSAKKSAIGCVGAYGVPWKWSTFMDCANPTTMPLYTLTNKPSTWQNVTCGQPFQKKWIDESDLDVVTVDSLSSMNCAKSPITWVISTKSWSVSTYMGANVTDYPYSLSYSVDGLSPFTVSRFDDTVIKIGACQNITCKQIPNTITIYVPLSTSHPSYTQSYVTQAVEGFIKPKILNYFTANSFPFTNIDDIVRVIPIGTGNRYFQKLATDGVPTLSGQGNTNISFVFVDVPQQYVSNCASPYTITAAFSSDIVNYKTVLSANTTTDNYKVTFFSVLSTPTGTFCDAADDQMRSIENGITSRYPLPYNLADYSTNINFVHDVNYASNTTPNIGANTLYYSDLIYEALKYQGVNLDDNSVRAQTSTICDSVTAVILSAPSIRLYTANRFMLVNSIVKFENVSLNLSKVASMEIDFNDGNIYTYTSTAIYNDFYITYNSPGYKSIKIISTDNTGGKTITMFPNIVKIVQYYD